MKYAAKEAESRREINQKRVGGEKKEGEVFTLTVFAMHVFVGEGWEGNEGGVVQDFMSLSDWLTGKLHPSYLKENKRGQNVREAEVKCKTVQTITTVTFIGKKRRMSAALCRFSTKIMNEKQLLKQGPD